MLRIATQGASNGHTSTTIKRHWTQGAATTTATATTATIGVPLTTERMTDKITTTSVAVTVRVVTTGAVERWMLR